MRASFGRVRTIILHGLQGIGVDVEATILPGLPSFELTGLGDSAIRESRNRVRAAIRNSGYEWPRGRIIVSFAPAWIQKQGTALDLALALAILIASSQIRRPAHLNAWGLFGELRLNGELHHLPALFCRLCACARLGISRVIIPYGNRGEARLLPQLQTVAVRTLQEAVRALSGLVLREADMPSTSTPAEPENLMDFRQLAGQPLAIRAATIAAAGHHPLLLLGSAGCGKTTLAKCLPGILPSLTRAESLEVTRIASAAGNWQGDSPLLSQAPFQNPHHTVSLTALLGPGSPPRPGLCSLAHRGVLFLDEVTEIRPQVLEALREPLENQEIRLARAQYAVRFPAAFLLVLAANPCPCGQYYETEPACTCRPQQIHRHLQRLSGPLRDRIDLKVMMLRLDEAEMLQTVQTPAAGCVSSATIREQVRTCRARQFARCADLGLPKALNGTLQSDRLLEVLRIPDAIAREAAQLAEGLHLSARSYQKVLRVARTLADLAAADDVRLCDIAEAMQFRLER